MLQIIPVDAIGGVTSRGLCRSAGCFVTGPGELYHGNPLWSPLCMWSQRTVVQLITSARYCSVWLHGAQFG